MKTIKKIGFPCLTALALLLTACSSDDGGNGGGSPFPTHIEASVDGAAFTTNIAAAGIASKNVSGPLTLITIQCSNANSITQAENQSIHIALVDITSVGTYAVNESTNSSIGYVKSHASSGNESWDTGDCAGANGTITVTSISATGIEGTFSFIGAEDDDCTSVKHVTEGHFKGTF